jgi:hypothetical protein
MQRLQFVLECQWMEQEKKFKENSEQWIDARRQ